MIYLNNQSVLSRLSGFIYYLLSTLTLTFSALFSDIKTEDGLSHSPGQTGLLSYSNFSSTPPSQSLYSYSHTHGQSETLYVLNAWTHYHTLWHTKLICTIFDFNLIERSIHPLSLTLLLPFPLLFFSFTSPLIFLSSPSLFLPFFTATPVLHQLRSGLLASKVSPPLLFSQGQAPFLHSDQQHSMHALVSVKTRKKERVRKYTDRGEEKQRGWKEERKKRWAEGLAEKQTLK